MASIACGGHQTPFIEHTRRVIATVTPVNSSQARYVKIWVCKSSILSLRAQLHLLSLPAARIDLRPLLLVVTSAAQELAVLGNRLHLFKDTTAPFLDTPSEMYWVSTILRQSL